MKGRHFAVKEKNNKRTKSIVLSAVAILELILLITSFTFSWFEGLSSLEIEGTGFGTAAALKSHVELGEPTGKSDLTYNEVIDLSKFFDEQEDVRLSPVSSSDAKTFYAAYEGEAGKEGAKYRKLTKEDVNSNIIQFQFNISSANSPTDVYLTDVLPKVKITPPGENTETIEYTYANRQSFPYRFAFSDGTNTYILKNYDNSNVNCNPSNQPAITSLNTDNTAVTSTGSVRNTKDFAISKTDKVIDIPTTPLFHLDKNETKTFTMTVWLEAFDYECTNNTDFAPAEGSAISFDIKLCTTWSVTTEITVYNYTADQWVDTYDENNKKTTSLYVRMGKTSATDDNSNNRQYELEYNESEKKWTGTIPIALQNCEFLWGVKGTDKVDPNNTWAKWQPKNRGNSTEITFLGINDACLWDVTPADLVKIHFRDYTNGNWINNKDDKGNDIDLAVKILFDGRYLDYSMTASPVLDNYQKNSWSCWIPVNENNPVDTVTFYRRGYNNNNEYVDFNYWVGTDRGTDTVYRAITESDGNTGGSDTAFTIYVRLDDSVADTFYANNRGKNPAISFTGGNNISIWENADKKTSISRYNFKPISDTWPNGETELTRVSPGGNLWYITFESKPEGYEYVTVWSRSGANNFNDTDTDMSFGVFKLFEEGKNYTTINITSISALTSNGASNNYVLEGTLDSSGAGAGSSGNATGSIETGVWGELAGPPTGNDRHFVHTSVVDSLSVSFTYANATFTYSGEEYFTKSADGKTWTTNVIPNSGATNIIFSDGTNTWTASEPGVAQTHYYVIKASGASSTGKWSEKLTPDGDNIYFVHTDSSVTSLTATYIWKEVPFTATFTKDSDGNWVAENIPNDGTSNFVFTDSKGNKWTQSDGPTSSNRYYYVTKVNGTSSTGVWSSKITLSGNASYFKHYNTSTSKMTATFTYSSVSFTVNLTKNTSDNLTWSTSEIPDSVTSVTYSDGTRSWTVSGKSTTNTTCYAISGKVAKFAPADYYRVYFKNNWKWTSVKIHYWGGSASSNWNSRPIMTKFATSGGYDIYYHLVPKNSNIIFTGNHDTNGSAQQTIDITSSNVTDMKGFELLWKNNSNNFQNWSVTTTFLNNN